MPKNVIHLPRPRELREPTATGALYLRVGSNDHRTLLDIVARGETGFFGAVIDAQNAKRHRDVIQELRQKGFDVALDPKTQPLATPGGHNRSLARLDWALERPHQVGDFDGPNGEAIAQKIATEVAESHFTQVIAPTHFLQSANDPWLRRDIRMAQLMRRYLDQQGQHVQLLYSLAAPVRLLRDQQERHAILASLSDAPIDALWLKVDGYGSDGTGDKTIGVIEACRDFHSLGIPIVADHVGGLPALTLLAFEAIGGIAHGITMLEGFQANRWRRTSEHDKPRVPAARVYIPALDLLLPKLEAQEFLTSSIKAQGRLVCRDTHCCPNGLKDMAANPARHFVRQRAQEIENIGAVPSTLRVGHFLDEKIRRVSDDVALIAGLPSLPSSIARKLVKKQRATGRFRDVIAKYASIQVTTTNSAIPSRRWVGG